MPTLRGIVAQIRDFFDFYNIAFVIAAVIVVGISLFIDAPLAAAVAVFTAIYTFIEFNQMRSSESVRRTSPIVRREFKKVPDSDNYDFGLRNFGPGPALYIRVHATIEPAGPSLTIPESEPPLHLPEGEFLSLTKGDLEELRDGESELFRRDDLERIELYYTFDSLSNRQTPPEIENPRKVSVQELVERIEKPRMESLDAIKKNCTSGSETSEEVSL